MRPDAASAVMLAVTRAKAKMYEYSLPESDHIQVTRDPAILLRLTLGMLGDAAAEANRTRVLLDNAPGAGHDVRFAARYFDAYEGSHLANVDDDHLLLLASAAYYLCDLPGSAGVLANRVREPTPDLGAGGLERLVCWLLRGDFTAALVEPEMARYWPTVEQVVRAVRAHYGLAELERDLADVMAGLRQVAYADGTARELFFADVCCAVAHRRIANSARYALPGYSRLPADAWEPAFRKPSFVRELWPAQRLLGREGVFAGASAVVQMPTSAGKTRATELAIRSAFLSGRATVAVVVAPFRALCHEIRDGLSRAFRGEAVTVDELTDVFQVDFNVAELLAGTTILVMTPEKLLYVLRHESELAARIGVLVLDEGHQFDAGARGVTYELLVTTLKGLITPGTQKLLISAVLSNASSIASWLNGEGSAVIAGSHLLPTERAVAFASWRSAAGQLHFVTPTDPEHEEFFVPRVIRATSLGRRGRERKPRRFPVKGDSPSIALYLALRLMPQGAVAVFCGRKDTATKLCGTLVEAFERGLDMDTPLTRSDAQETANIALAYQRNIGADAPATRAASIGAFTHHGNTPHGVRLAVEHALKQGSGRFVICTSTLAQGVNLPIRYLIVTTNRQGGEKIKVRDFHNLMGRAGRSGMHTEGTVIFADPNVFASRTATDGPWADSKALLQVGNSEPCASTLLSVLDPLLSDGGRRPIVVDPLVYVRAHVADTAGHGAWVDATADILTSRWFSRDSLRRQLVARREIMTAIESFLMAHWQPDEARADRNGFGAGPVEALARQTLAYHLASAAQRPQLLELFSLLAANVGSRVADPERRIAFARTLLGVSEAIDLEQWVRANQSAMSTCADEEQLLATVWPAIEPRIENGVFRRWQPRDTVLVAVKSWLMGESFHRIHEVASEADVRVGSGVQPRRLQVEHVVEMGESGFGFDAALILGAIIELFSLVSPIESDAAVALLQRLQKRLKYGLPSEAAVALYEAGFADRPLAIALADVVPEVTSRAEVRPALRVHRAAAEGVLVDYPNYYRHVFDRVAGE